jgi:hypothetical protein
MSTKGVDKAIGVMPGPTCTRWPACCTNASPACSPILVTAQNNRSPDT